MPEKSLKNFALKVRMPARTGGERPGILATPPHPDTAVDHPRRPGMGAGSRGYARRRAARDQRQRRPKEAIPGAVVGTSSHGSCRATPRGGGEGMGVKRTGRGGCQWTTVTPLPPANLRHRPCTTGPRTEGKADKKPFLAVSTNASKRNHFPKPSKKDRNSMCHILRTKSLREMPC